MRMLKVCFLFFTCMALSSVLHAQTDTLVIHTSAECGTCKSKIEKNMNYERGVKSAELDLSTKNLTLVYNPEKTNPDKLRLALSRIGYDADTVQADQKAYQRLPDCCKKGGHRH